MYYLLYSDNDKDYLLTTEEGDYVSKEDDDWFASLLLSKHLTFRADPVISTYPTFEDQLNDNNGMYHIYQKFNSLEEYDQFVEDHPELRI